MFYNYLIMIVNKATQNFNLKVCSESLKSACKYIKQKCIAHHLLVRSKVVSAHYVTISHLRHKYVHTALELSTSEYYST